MALDNRADRSGASRFLPWLWLWVTVALLGVVVITTVPAWLVAGWIAASIVAVIRLGGIEQDPDS